MSLPPEIASIIERMAAGRAGLAAASQKISDQYRRTEGRSTLALQNETEAVAYAAARMPGTFAAVAHVLAQMDDFSPRTLLDFGAGPGTATLAARSLWPDIASTMLEPNAAMRGMAQKLIAGARWLDAPAPSDLIIAAYVLNELTEPVAAALKLWEACTDRLVLVDTGTSAAHAMMMRVRDALLATGAHLHAPCPHAQTCPFLAADGWCHFSVRLARSRLHKSLKDADLGYEDEKFTYLVFGRAPRTVDGARIVGYPRVGKIVDLPLCRRDGTLANAQISKRDTRYKQARKSRWGDVF